MKFSLLALSTAAALGGTDAFLAPQQPRLSSSALAGYGIGSWNKKSSPSSAGGGGAAVATRNPWDDANKANTVSKSDTFIKAPTTKKSYGLGSWNKSASPGGTTSAVANAPPSAAAATGGCPFHANYDAIRDELKLIMDNPSWDDGSLAPIFLRLAWHSSGTYDAATGTGGSNGAGMRFQNEAADPENAGLAPARAFLEPVKRKFPEISYSDLWILAAYVGLEVTGGPVIDFQPGRVDHPDESYWEQMSYGRLPAAEKYCCPHLDDSNVSSSLDETGKVKGWEGLCTHVRNEVFYRMGFNDQEIVALLCGGHVYGRCHPNASGYAGPWVENMTEFSNEYATDMIEDEWTLVSHGDTWLDAQGSAELRPAPGNRQFVNQKKGVTGDDPNQMMLLSDMILAWDPDFRPILEMYAEDEDKLKVDFGAAFKRLTELGCGFP
eukprot:CAMPEP_0113414392 /NCGR_PEP_ID=MMETSP0013_2-20120614/23989_1 /TAXON_ID=2843 ORGANISM="Skeletonema costatum, Strain 1716" /NCGR_SAMPLE_ID=MMETSP0013_2 /ASSEMBLY_ACC=CAM_ASM_000158 /LENGTH=436 /DNA_ID=CAMNT_0000301239 /DNA_START=46 /DNA_END=1356 /DNA_ORIENTATION=- /assembly_acc=CAM_ASM_000158